MDQKCPPVDTVTEPAPAMVHRAEHAVSLPQGLPATEDGEPRVELTQAQINYLVNHVPAGWVSTIKAYWPIVLFLMGVCGKMGAVLDRAVTQLPPEPPAIVKPVVEAPKAKTAAPDLQQMIEDAVKRAVEPRQKSQASAESSAQPFSYPSAAKAEPKTPAVVAEKTEPKERFEFKKD